MGSCSNAQTEPGHNATLKTCQHSVLMSDCQTDWLLKPSQITRESKQGGYQFYSKRH